MAGFHIQTQIVSGASGRLSTVATENQYPGEAVKKIRKQKVLYLGGYP